MCAPNITSNNFVSAKQQPECRVYAKRWFILVIFVLYSMSNAFQWIEYSIIANIVQNFYRVPSTYIDWTSMIYMVLYIPFIFPATWLIDKFGLRVAVILGALGNCSGAWIKVFSVDQDRFFVTFIGQFITGLSQIFVIGVPAPLAAQWFAPSQVSTACSIGVLGNQLGVALGFLIPSIIVKNSDNVTVVADSLSVLFYSVAIFCTVILVVIVIFFQAAPDLPPSPNQSANRSAPAVSYTKSIKNLVTNSRFMLLFLAYGINVGIFYAVSTLLNQIILIYYPGKEEDGGRIGLLLTIAGMLGSFCCGVVLDKTSRFKETTAAVYLLSVVGIVAFTFTLSCGYIVVVYITASFLGFFMTGYLPVGFEFGAELTYPEPEGTSSGLLNASGQVFGILLTVGGSWLLTNKGDVWTNGTFCCAMAVGLVITALIGSDLRRQASHVESQKSPVA